MRRKSLGDRIPWWLVVVTLIAATPIGVVLAAVKLFSAEIERLIRTHLPGVAKILNLDAPASSDAEESWNPAVQSGRMPQMKKKKRRSKSFGVTAVVLCIVAGMVLFGSVVDGFEQEVFQAGLILLLVGGAFALAARLTRRREDNRARFLAIIGERDSVHLQKLADAALCRLSLVKSELQHLIDEGAFGARAYIDESNLCFMRFPEALPDTVCESAPPPKAESTAAQEPAVEGEDYDVILRRIRELDDAIYDVPVSARILRIERITRHIFEYVSDFPEKKNQVRKFMNYYLPTTLKLLESYSRIERAGASGKNMRETKERIESALDMIVQGFETQLDLLYSSENVDISSDIDVLEQMMSQDGLKENTDFTTGA